MTPDLTECVPLDFERGSNGELVAIVITIAIMAGFLVWNLWRGWDHGWVRRDLKAHLPFRPRDVVLILSVCIAVLLSMFRVATRRMEVSSCGVRVQTLFGWDEMRWEDVKQVDHRSVIMMGDALVLDAGMRWITLYLANYWHPGAVHDYVAKQTPQANQWHFRR